MEPSTSLPPASSRSGCLERRTGSSLCSSTKISPVMDQGLDGHSMDCDMESSTEQCPSTKRVHAQGYCQFTKELRLSALKKISKEAHWTSPLVRLPKIVPTVPSSIPESKEQSRLNLASSSLLPSEASPPPLKKQFSEYDLTQTLQSRISSSCSPKSGSDTPTLSQESDQ